jgi:hypothetical protein
MPATLAPSPSARGGVILRTPSNDERIIGQSAFVWEYKPEFQFAPGELHELVVWGPNENPMASGRSPVGASLGSAFDVNLTAVEGPLGLTPGQQYFWGVRQLVNGVPKRMLSEERSFWYERASSGGGGGTAPGFDPAPPTPEF